jgi:hypothetical protein
MEAILLVLVGLLALPFVLGPLLVKATQRLPAHPTFESIDPEEGLAGEVYDLFKNSIVPLGEAGFTDQVFLRQKDQIPGQTIHLCTLANTSTQDLAMVVHMRQSVEKGKDLRVPYVEYYTRFQGDTSVTTNNNDEIMPFPKQKGRRVTQFPDIKDPKRLFEIHRAIQDLDGHGSAEPAPGADGLEAVVIESMVKEFEAQTKTGYLFLAASGEYYRPTWKGAILMTWKLCWPVSAIIRGQRNRESAASLKRLGK